MLSNDCAKQVQVLPMASRNIPQRVKIIPGRTCIHFRITRASLRRVETIHFDIWSHHPPKSSGLIWERDGIINTGFLSVIVLWRCAALHQCTGEPSTSLWASAKALWTLSSTCYCSEVQHYKAPRVAKCGPSSLNSNSIRLLLCVFVSFRSHLAITGANLGSAPGYSVKMTDLSYPPPHTHFPTPRSCGVATPGVPTHTDVRMPQIWLFNEEPMLWMSASSLAFQRELFRIISSHF